MTKAEMVEKLEQAKKLIEKTGMGMQEEAHTDIEEWCHNLINHVHEEVTSIQRYLKAFHVEKI